MAKKISKELLIKYHQNQCSEVERKAVKEWLELNDAEDASGELELVNREEIDSDQIWFNVSQNVSQLENQRPFEQAVKTRSLAVRYRSYAAAVLVLFAVGFSTYYLFDAIELTGNTKVADQYQTIQTQRGEKRTVTLSDGSTIRMNYETQIQVPEQFEGDERIVYLTGHAHFDVVRDTERPFVIYTEDSKTQVLGTSFDINTKEKGATEIIVTSGKVAFSDKNQENNLVTLTLNNRAVLGADNSIVTDEVDALILTAWKDNRLVLKDKTLKEIVSVLEPWFDVQVTVENQQLLDDRFSLSLNNPPLTGALERLAFMGSFDYQIDGKKVIIR
ncbi:MAG: FecR domain-containing protein [Bacteroidota bacterium]